MCGHQFTHGLIEGFGVRLGGLARHEPGDGRWDQGDEGGMIWLFDVCIEVYDVEETSAPDGYSLPEDKDQECEISENTDPQQQCTFTIGTAGSYIIRVRYDPSSIDVRISNGNREVVIAVTDSGPGVAAEERELIFEPFFRGDRSGLGLRLSIAKSVVELRNGRIWVEDNPQGNGSTFFVALPRHVTKAPVAPASATA